MSSALERFAALDFLSSYSQFDLLIEQGQSIANGQPAGGVLSGSGAKFIGGGPRLLCPQFS
jgi:hypothetical protein